MMPRPLPTLPLAGAVLAGAALLASSLWGGMLGDRLELLGPGTLDRIGFPLACLLAVVALALAYWRGGPFSAHGAALPAIGLAGWAALSLIRTPVLHDGLLTFAILCSALALGAAVSRVASVELLGQGVALAQVTSAAIVAALGVSEYVRPLLLHNTPFDPAWRVFSTFSAPNFLSGFLAMSLPLAAAAFLSSRERGVTLLASVALLLQAACLLLTGSRFGLFAGVVGFALFAVAATRAGALRGASRRRALLLAGLCALALVVGFKPIYRRIRTAGSESYSNLYRLYTWRGAAKMVAAKPVLGSGVGSFNTSFGPYAEVATTQHAHNSYLQLAGETGAPGALCLLALIGASLAAACFRRRAAPEDEEAEPLVREVQPPTPHGNGIPKSARRARRRPEAAPVEPAAVSIARRLPLDPALVRAGLLGAIAAAALRSLFDSDLYVPANAFALAALAGLALAGTDSDPASPRPQAVRRVALAASVLAALICLSSLGAGRLLAAGGEAAVNARDLHAALDSFRQASTADPLEPEYALRLASLYASARDSHTAELQLQRAVKLAPVAKSYYRFGRFLLEQGRPVEAAAKLEQAVHIEPGNLQSALALADADVAAGRPDQADAVYLRMIQLSHGAYGRVRALPELVPFEFGLAHAGLGESAYKRGDFAAADREYAEADQTLGEFWAGRGQQMVQITVSHERVLDTGRRYLAMLQRWSDTLRRLGRAADADAVTRRANELSAEIDKEAAARSQ